MNTCLTASRLSVLWLACALLPGSSIAGGKNCPDFYAYCIEMGVKAVKPRPLSEQVTLLRQLGYDGIALPLPAANELASTLKLLDDSGLKPFMFWTQVTVDPGKSPAFDPGLLDAIGQLKGRPAITISVLLGGLKPGDPSGMEPAIHALRTLGDAASAAGVRISIYNHVNNWTESLPFAIDVVRRVNHPQVGFNFNLCHWLKVDGAARDYRPLLRDNAGKLFCVTINGAQTGATAWTGGLIQPLDKGDFDNRALLASLAEIGYAGPVGLMCFGVPDDAPEHLARSMRVWKSWQKKTSL